MTPIHVLCDCYAKIFCGLNVFLSLLMKCVVVKNMFVGIMPSHSHRVAFRSLYGARPSFEYYRQVYFVHSRLQDESLQVTISKLL